LEKKTSVARTSTTTTMATRSLWLRRTDRRKRRTMAVSLVASTATGVTSAGGGAQAMARRSRRTPAGLGPRPSTSRRKLLAMANSGKIGSGRNEHGRPRFGEKSSEVEELGIYMESRVLVGPRFNRINRSDCGLVRYLL
jgi:hypothetical protein